MSPGLSRRQVHHRAGQNLQSQRLRVEAAGWVCIDIQLDLTNAEELELLVEWTMRVLPRDGGRIDEDIDVDEFWNQLGLDLPDAPAIDAKLKTQLAVDSSFFLARIQVNYYDARLILA